MVQNASKSAMHNGLIAGALLSVKFLLTAIQIPVLSSLTFFISIGIIVFLFLVTKKFRDTFTDGYMTYGSAFSYVFRVYFYGAVIASLVMLIYCMANKGFLPVMLNDVLMMYDKIGYHLNDETYKALEMVFKPTSYALFNLVGSAIVGAFWGLILAIFLKKEKSIFED